MRVADALRLAIQIAETAIAVAAREAPGEAARLRHALQKLQRSI